MTSYGDAHTGRMIVRYTIFSTAHRIKLRQLSSVTEAVFLATVARYLSSLAPGLPPGSFAWGAAEYAPAGSTTYFPVTVAITAPTGTAADAANETQASYFNVDVRSGAGGRLAHSLHTGFLVKSPDMRLRLGHNALSDIWLNAFNAEAANLAGSDGNLGSTAAYLSSGIASADLKKARS